MDIVERLRMCANGFPLFKTNQGDYGVCDEAADEIERLRERLKRANENHEHFQREWYLRGDEIERLRQLVHELNSVAYVIDGHGIAHHNFTIVYKELE